MNPVITPARRVANIHRDTTIPQRLSLPINAPLRPKAHPLTIIGIFAASGFAMFAIIAVLFNLR